MLYLWSTILIILNAFWLLLIPFALPGNWLIIVSTALFAWWQEEKVFSAYTLIVITVLALIGELIEFFSGVLGARKAGACFLGLLGAFIGAVIGAVIGSFLFPILGTLLGSCAGAAAGVCVLEIAGGRRTKDVVNLGLGAGLGRLFGTTAKMALGILIWLIVAIAAFWP